MEDGAHPIGADNLPVRRASTRFWVANLDLAACAGLVLLAAVAFLFLPEGSSLRLALGLGVLFFAPGYLLIEASAGPAPSRSSRAARLGLAIGASPALVGVLALATAVLPEGFRPVPIVVLLVVASFVLAGAAVWRRGTPTRNAAPDVVPA
jgi:uncharacterized membrane protein